VHLTVTSDVAEEVHNHYNDKEVEVAAGGTATFDFVATQQGVYEVELHHANKVLMQLQVG
jgi:predicted secreted protein